eukprot:TRINITY_DN7086_c0_g1_i1.p1 TRINITY_DN7086_c0_g1~~TRINITY_DN7086_c0_g1_i1.p1  ORF type:complete len:438 (-),score=55.83 TRINITY_DN7086_c0_g1_i1:287-1600(-)
MAVATMLPMPLSLGRPIPHPLEFQDEAPQPMLTRSKTTPLSPVCEVSALRAEAVAAFTQPKLKRASTTALSPTSTTRSLASVSTPTTIGTTRARVISSASIITPTNGRTFGSLSSSPSRSVSGTPKAAYPPGMGWTPHAGSQATPVFFRTTSTSNVAAFPPGLGFTPLAASTMTGGFGMSSVSTPKVVQFQQQPQVAAVSSSARPSPIKRTLSRAVTKEFSPEEGVLPKAVLLMYRDSPSCREEAESPEAAGFLLPEPGWIRTERSDNAQILSVTEAAEAAAKAQYSKPAKDASKRMVVIGVGPAVAAAGVPAATTQAARPGVMPAATKPPAQKIVSTQNVVVGTQNATGVPVKHVVSYASAVTSGAPAHQQPSNGYQQARTGHQQPHTGYPQPSNGYGQPVRRQQYQHHAAPQAKGGKGHGKGRQGKSGAPPAPAS